jgi:hypothetical protein
MVEEMLAARGISMTHETIRHGALNSAKNSPIAPAGERLPIVVGTNGGSDERPPQLGSERDKAIRSLRCSHFASVLAWPLYVFARIWPV